MVRSLRVWRANANSGEIERGRFSTQACSPTQSNVKSMGAMCTFPSVGTVANEVRLPSLTPRSPRDVATSPTLGVQRVATTTFSPVRHLRRYVVANWRAYKESVAYEGRQR